MDTMICSLSNAVVHRGSQEVENGKVGVGEMKPAGLSFLASGTLLPVLKVVQQLKDKRKGGRGEKESSIRKLT